eukprot:1334506-Amorphochlora_amoeboformis.AAC.1
MRGGIERDLDKEDIETGRNRRDEESPSNARASATEFRRLVMKFWLIIPRATPCKTLHVRGPRVSPRLTLGSGGGVRR